MEGQRESTGSVFIGENRSRIDEAVREKSVGPRGAYTVQYSQLDGPVSTNSSVEIFSVDLSLLYEVWSAAFS